MKKANKNLNSSPGLWADSFNTADQFIKWCKLIAKHIKKRQFIEIYGNYFVYCNAYIKNVSEVLKRLNLTLNLLIELMYDNQIINRNDDLKNYI